MRCFGEMDLDQSHNISSFCTLPTSLPTTDGTVAELKSHLLLRMPLLQVPRIPFIVTPERVPKSHPCHQPSHNRYYSRPRPGVLTDANGPVPAICASLTDSTQRVIGDVLSPCRTRRSLAGIKAKDPARKARLSTRLSSSLGSICVCWHKAPKWRYGGFAVRQKGGVGQS